MGQQQALVAAGTGPRLALLYGRFSGLARPYLAYGAYRADVILRESVVVGLVVYLLLSRSGPLGFLGWMFTFQAMVVAQTVLVLPVVTALTRQVIEDADRAHGEQWQSLGASPFQRGLLLGVEIWRHSAVMPFQR